LAHSLEVTVLSSSPISFQTGPFQLGKLIDQKPKRIYDLANRRLSPPVTSERCGAPAKDNIQRGRRNGCGKACKSRKKRAIRTFLQPRRRRVFGYIPNISGDNPRVTFLSGLTRGTPGIPLALAAYRP